MQPRQISAHFWTSAARSLLRGHAAARLATGWLVVGCVGSPVASHPADPELRATIEEPDPTQRTELDQPTPSPPAAYRGSGPAAPRPSSAQVQSPPLPESPAPLQSVWFRPGAYLRPVTASQLELGVVLLGKAEIRGDEGISRLSGQGELLWHLPGPVDQCVLSDGGNVICELKDFEVVVFDELGREVWRKNLVAHVADGPTSGPAGFGPASAADELSLLDMRALVDFVFIHSYIQWGAGKRGDGPHSVMCVGLDGELRWIEGSQLGGGISWARTRTIFEAPAELANDIALTSLPAEPWQARIPSSESIEVLRRRHGKRIRWFRTEQGWFMIIEVGPPDSSWHRLKLKQFNHDGALVRDVEFESPDEDHKFFITAVVDGPHGNIFALWNDGRVYQFIRNRSPIQLRTHADDLRSFEQDGRHHLLVHRLPRATPGFSVDREPGVELFELPPGP